jgi:hypothetical protein
LIVTLIAMLFVFPDVKSGLHKAIIIGLAAFWSLVPPIWFLWEWHDTPAKDQDLEDLKYSQEASRNIWLGVVALLAFLADFLSK